MQSDKHSAKANALNPAQATDEAHVQVESPTVPAPAPALVKAAYRKSVMRKLGLLRSVAGSDPFLNALP